MLFSVEQAFVWPVPGSQIVGSAELRKRKHENKTGGNCERRGGSLPFSFFLDCKTVGFFLAPPTFRVPFSLASSPLPESLEQASACGEGWKTSSAKNASVGA